MHARFAAGSVVAGLLVALSWTALAADGNERAQADATLREVETSPRKDLAAEPLGRARAALDRAAKLRASGDEGHAKLAEGVARTWAEAARDLVRAAEVEERAHAARRNAADAGVVAERERALLEEGMAQSGRVRAQLDAVTRDTKEPARTSAAANEPDGGAP
ncbi:MAG: hypothetical protein JWP97_319, partial [Labilithrix sp.]|nr:hypothetical protein [Labilithrix sp.]